MISQRVEEEGSAVMAEAVILNEKVRQQAPKDWNALVVIKQWRKKKECAIDSSIVTKWLLVGADSELATGLRNDFATGTGRIDQCPLCCSMK